MQYADVGDVFTTVTGEFRLQVNTILLIILCLNISVVLQKFRCEIDQKQSHDYRFDEFDVKADQSVRAGVFRRLS